MLIWKWKSFRLMNNKIWVFIDLKTNKFYHLRQISKHDQWFQRQGMKGNDSWGSDSWGSDSWGNDSWGSNSLGSDSWGSELEYCSSWQEVIESVLGDFNASQVVSEIMLSNLWKKRASCELKSAPLSNCLCTEDAWISSAACRESETVWEELRKGY